MNLQIGTKLDGTKIIAFDSIKLQASGISQMRAETLIATKNVTGLTITIWGDNSTDSASTSYQWQIKHFKNTEEAT